MVTWKLGGEPGNSETLEEASEGPVRDLPPQHNYITLFSFYVSTVYIHNLKLFISSRDPYSFVQGLLITIKIYKK